MNTIFNFLFSFCRSSTKYNYTLLKKLTLEETQQTQPVYCDIYFERMFKMQLEYFKISTMAVNFKEKIIYLCLKSE